MNYRFPNSPPPGGFFSRLVGAIVGLFIMVGLFFLGLTVFAAAAGIALVAFIVFYIRLWWLRRKMRGQGGQQGYYRESRYREQGNSRDSVTLEGEYHEKRD
ncbi:MAG: hypothetical protein R3270_02870 [Gammaproteobacteria bacterium]|nr:hypothetical protein [Gammaproteobacteria bacterium]